jgi:hypothetical protein
LKVAVGACPEISKKLRIHMRPLRAGLRRSLLREIEVEAIGALIVATNGRCQGTFSKQIPKLRRAYIAHPGSVKEIGLDV